MADSQVKNLTAITTPADGDVMYVQANPSTTPLDRKFAWSDVKATLKTYFDTLYGVGTVTATGGALTANAVVLGAGTTDTKVVAGITTDGTSVLNLGVNTTTLGKIKMFGNTSGDATIQPAAIAGTATVLTLPAISTTLLGTNTTNTVSNKRNTERVTALSAGSATPAINTDSFDVVHITAQSAAITSFTTNLTGTPVDGDSLRISITDNGTARALTFGASFEASGTVPLPTTTVISTRLDIAFFWNTETSKWRCIGVA